MVKTEIKEKNTQIMNMVVILIWLVVFLIIILGIVFPLVYIVSLKKIYLEEQRTILSISSEYLDEFIKQRRTIVSLYAATDDIREPLKEIKPRTSGTSVVDRDLMTIRRHTREILEWDKGFSSFSLLSETGRELLFIESLGEQGNVNSFFTENQKVFTSLYDSTIAQYLQWDKRSKLDPLISPEFVISNSVEPMIAVTMPITDDKGDLLGVLSGFVALSRLNAFAKDVMAGKTGKLFVVDANSTLFVSSDAGAFKDSSQNPMVSLALKGLFIPGVFRYPNTGRMVLASYQRIDSLGWTIVLEQTLSEVFSIVKVYVYTIVFLVLLTILVSFVIFLYIARETAESMRKHQELLIISETDPLTGLLNRRSMLSRMSQLISDSEQPNQSFILAMFDIDDFKQVNDTYGHIFGDIVLREIAARAVSILRVDDLLFRWGGEEFLLIIRNSDLVRGRGVAEKIRRVVCDAPISNGEISTTVTVTIGVAMYQGGSIDSLIIHADEALYQGKRSGKNRVVVSEDRDFPI